MWLIFAEDEGINIYQNRRCPKYSVESENEKLRKKIFIATFNQPTVLFLSYWYGNNES